MSEWDGLLLEQLADLLGQGQPSEWSEGERRLAAQLIFDTYSDCLAGKQEAREWVSECSRDEGGFGWYCGILGLQPLKLKVAILSQTRKGGQSGQAA